jgi:hypothetical protein
MIQTSVFQIDNCNSYFEKSKTRLSQKIKSTQINSDSLVG